MVKLRVNMNNFFNFKCFHKTEDAIFFFISTWMYKETTFAQVEEVLCQLSRQYKHLHAFLIPWWYRDGADHYTLLKKYCTTVTMLANTLEDNIYYNLNSFDSIYCNQNCWIDNNTFNISNKKKQYDIVINANNQPWKNHAYVANLNATKLFITYDVTDTDLQIFNPTKIFKNLLPAHVCSALNECRIGLALSTKEGACYASTEYLLCGLPVISIKSKGGRHIWYNETNSIIVESKEMIEATILQTLRNIQQFQPQKIRDNCISKQNMFRDMFYTYIQNKFGIDNIKQVIEDNFTTRMLKYINLENLDIEGIINL